MAPASPPADSPADPPATAAPRRSARDVRGRPADELRGPPAPRPAPDTARSWVLLVLDSLRFDSLAAAGSQVLPRLGPLQCRHSYATWTAPSHYNLLMGLLPHPAPQHVFASTWYTRDFEGHRERLGLPDLALAGMLPQMWLPEHLRTLGYRTGALVSMPVINPHTPLNVGFDRYELAPRHNDLDALLDRMDFDPDRPSFWLLNTGETHYPYATAADPDESGPAGDWPVLHGVRGVFQQVSQGRPLHRDEAPAFFDQDKLDALRQRQIRAARALDRQLERLLDLVPPGTWVTVTSDHGELFGEGGWFGHGPIPHRKVLEVPLVEGLAR